MPIAFGMSLTPPGLRTAAIFCLLFGAGGQMVAGVGNLVNKNLYGGTLFTAFAFNWVSVMAFPSRNDCNRPPST